MFNLTYTVLSNPFRDSELWGPYGFADQPV